MRRIPKSRIAKQSNRSDVLGDLWASNNLDLDSNYGTIRCHPRMILATNSDSLANLGVPCATISYKASGNDDVGAATRFIWAVAGARIFHSNAGANGTWKQDITGGSPTALNSNQSDIEEFNGSLYFSGASTSIFKFNGTWSTVTSVFANSSGLHAMVYFRPRNRLYFVDDNSASIGSIGTNDAPATLGNQYTLNDLVKGSEPGEAISWIDANSQYIFIGTISYSGKQSKIYFWNGSTQNTPDGFYTIDANGTLGCVIKDDVPVVIDTRGRLLQLNGGTFVELDRLPFEDEPPTTYLTTPTARLCHYNGIELINQNINILVNTTLYNTNSTNKENVPSGIWEYTPETGLYHKASLGLSTSDGTIVDYGQQKLLEVGCLQEINAPWTDITKGSINGNFLAGAKYYTDATTTKNGIWYDDTKDTLQKAGGFTTTKELSGNIDDVWQEIYLRYKKLLTANDKIVVKYRTEEEESSEFTVTWTGNNSFTTTENVLGKEDWEIEGIQGQGSGECSHIKSAILQDGEYHVELDQELTTKSGTGKVRLQNWKKAGTISLQDTNFEKFPVEKGTAIWLQIKVWFLLTGKNEIFDIIIKNTKNE